MSRSYKKYPVWKDNNNPGAAKWWKRRFNRRLRHLPIDRTDLIERGKFKRLNNSWDIHDYSFSCSWKEYKELYHDRDISEQDLKAEWYRTYRSK